MRSHRGTHASARSRATVATTASATTSAGIGRGVVRSIGAAAGFEEAGVDHAGNDDADVDARSDDLGAQTLGERIESRLGRRIDGFARDARATGDGRHEADCAALPRDHSGEQRVGELDRGDQIDLDEPPDRIDGHRRERPGMAEPGVVDQDVDPSEGVHGLVCEPFAVRR